MPGRDQVLYQSTEWTEKFPIFFDWVDTFLLLTGQHDLDEIILNIFLTRWNSLDFTLIFYV